jgi:hypothetical protein
MDLTEDCPPPSHIQPADKVDKKSAARVITPVVHPPPVAKAKASAAKPKAKAVAAPKAVKKGKVVLKGRAPMKGVASITSFFKAK